MEKKLRHLIHRIDPILLLIFLVALLVRAWAFRSIPGGLNQDEAASAYNAYALLHYGIDQNGFPFPVVLVSWGSGMYTLASYLAAPFIGLFGLSITVARLPHLLAGLLDMIIFTRLVWLLTNKQTAILAAFLLAILPWHIMISRWGLESNLFPSIFLLGVYCMVLALKRPWFLVASFSCFGLSLYSYGTSYIAVPVFLVLTTIYASKHRYWKLAPFLSACGLFMLIATPIVLFLAINTFHWRSIVTPFLSIPHLSGTPRFETVGNIHITDPQFFMNLWKNFVSAFTLFVTQNDSLLWNTIPEYGALYLFAAPLVILGFALLCKEWITQRTATAALMLAWCASAMILSLLVSVNLNRINVALFPLVYCATLGVAFFRKNPSVFISMIVVYIFSFLNFAWAYFTVYPAQIEPLFFEGMTEAISSASVNPSSKICVTDAVTMPYIFALFATRENPHVFLQTVHYENPGGEFQKVSQYGRYIFGLHRCNEKKIDTYVIRANEMDQFAKHHFISQQFGGYIVLRKQ